MVYFFFRSLSIGVQKKQFKSHAISSSIAETIASPQIPHKSFSLQMKQDPTTKATDELIQSLFGQNHKHEKKPNRSNATIQDVRYRRIPVKKNLSVAISKISVDANSSKTNCKEANDFGQLCCERVESYTIPNKILQIENGSNVSHLTKINDLINRSQLNRSVYKQAYTALLELEEAAEALQLQNYNQTVQLTFSNCGRQFLIKNDVSYRPMLSMFFILAKNIFQLCFFITCILFEKNFLGKHYKYCTSS